MPDIEKLIAAFEDPAVIELMINDDGSVFVEDGLGVRRLNVAPSAADVLVFVNGVVGVAGRFGPDHPFADLVGIDGSRVHVVAPPVVRALAVTIRKRPPRRPTLDELAAGGVLTDGCADFLDYCVQQRLNVLIAGGTGSGKTTLLSALAAQVDSAERILVLEDTPELTLRQTHVMYMRTCQRDGAARADVTLRDLVINTLRMRPDRVIIGETRGPEAADMLAAMNVGHDGILTTLHASSAREALQRLETLVLQASGDMPMKAVRAHIVSAIDFVVFLARLSDGTRRVVQVSEVTGLEVDTISLSDLFLLDLRKNPAGLTATLRATGAVPRFYDRLRKQGVEPPMEFFKPAG